MVTHGFRAAVGPVFFGHPHLTNTATWGTLVPLSGLVLREANPLPGGMHVSIPKDTERNLKPLSLPPSLSLPSLSLSLSLYIYISPGRGHGNPLQYFCLENPYGLKSLVGYSPWGCTESGTTEVT